VAKGCRIVHHVVPILLANVALEHAWIEGGTADHAALPLRGSSATTAPLRPSMESSRRPANPHREWSEAAAGAWLRSFQAPGAPATLSTTTRLCPSTPIRMSLYWRSSRFAPRSRLAVLGESGYRAPRRSPPDITQNVRRQTALRIQAPLGLPPSPAQGRSGSRGGFDEGHLTAVEFVLDGIQTYLGGSHSV